MLEPPGADEVKVLTLRKAQPLHRAYPVTSYRKLKSIWRSPSANRAADLAARMPGLPVAKDSDSTIIWIHISTFFTRPCMKVFMSILLTSVHSFKSPYWQDCNSFSCVSQSQKSIWQDGLVTFWIQKPHLTITFLNWAGWMWVSWFALSRNSHVNHCAVHPNSRND